MPLIKCPQCGSMISTKAAVCPKCGYAANGSMQNHGGSNQPYYPSQQSMQHNYPPEPSVVYGPPVPSQEKELSKWNWGAFLLNWIWGLGNGVYWPIVIIITSFIPYYIGAIAHLGICIYLGVKGNHLAWNAKKWNNWDYFLNAQKKWTRAGWWVLAISIILGTIAIITLIRTGLIYELYYELYDY